MTTLIYFEGMVALPPLVSNFEFSVTFDCPQEIEIKINKNFVSFSIWFSAGEQW